MRSDNGKAALTVRQFTNHLLNLKIDTLDKRNITSKHLGRRGLHLNQSGSNLLTKNIISNCGNFENLIDPQNLERPEILIMKMKRFSLKTSTWNHSHLKRFPYILMN